MIKFKIIENNNIEDAELYLKGRYKKLVIEGEHTKQEYDELIQQIMLTNSNYIKALQWTEWIDVWYQKYYEMLWNHRNEFILKSYNTENTTNVNLSIASIFSKLKNKKMLVEKDMPNEDVINYPKITINPVKKYNAFVNLEFIVEFAEWSQPVDEWDWRESLIGKKDSWDHYYTPGGTWNVTPGYSDLKYMTEDKFKYPLFLDSYYMGFDTAPYARLKDQEAIMGGTTFGITNNHPYNQYDHYIYINKIKNYDIGDRDYYLSQWNHRNFKNNAISLNNDHDLLSPMNIDNRSFYNNETIGINNIYYNINYFQSDGTFIRKYFDFKKDGDCFNDTSKDTSYYNKFYKKIFGENKFCTIGDPGNSIFFLRYFNNTTSLISPPREQIIYDWWRHIDDYAFVTKERIFSHKELPKNLDFTNDTRNKTDIIDPSLKKDIQDLTYVRPYLTKFNMYKLSVPMEAKFISNNLKIIFPNWDSISKPFHDETKPNEMQHQLLSAQIVWKKIDGTTYNRLLNNTMFVSDWFEPEKYNVGENKGTTNDREFLAYDWKKEFMKGRKGAKITNDDSWSIPSDISMEEINKTKLNSDDIFMGINIFIWLTDRFYPYNRDTEIPKFFKELAESAINSKENYFNFPSRVPLVKIGDNWNFNDTLVWMNVRGYNTTPLFSGEYKPLNGNDNYTFLNGHRYYNGLKIDKYLRINNELRYGTFRKEKSKQEVILTGDDNWLIDINNFRDDFVPNEGMFTQFLNILNRVYRG